MANSTSKKILFCFLICHLFIWTLIPSLSNSNLPRDTIEALAWGSNLDWGFEKHPPFSAFASEMFYQIFGNSDWAFYLMSQIFVISSFFIVWIFSKDFFKKPIFCLISVLLLEGIYFYNYTTPEFNVNISQLPFWALTVLFAWRGLKNDKIVDWLLFGFFAALGVLSKYLFVYLLIALAIFIFYSILKKKTKYKFLISLISFFLILSPHLIWLLNNEFVTITYGLHRSTGDFYSENSIITSHIKYPLIFLLKQIGILIPFFIMLLIIVSNFKDKLFIKDKNLKFLLSINIIPIIFIFITSLLFGINIRTMWMTPFYLFFGVLFIYIFQRKINLKRFKYFFILFLFFFLLSPTVYFSNSVIKKDQRIDYPGKEIARIVQKKWDENFKNQIKVVIGQSWWAGNLSYHIQSRPKFIRGYLNYVKSKINIDDGVVYIEDEGSNLTKSCPGVSFITYSRYICLVGIK